MRDRAIAKRYAQALFEVVDQRVQEDVCEEMLAISQAMQHPDIAHVFANPRTPKQFKEQLIKSLQPSPPAEALIRVLLANKRLHLLGEAAKAFQALVYAARGKTKAEVLSAIPLSQEILAALQEKLANLTGKKVEIVTRVDETLWGGLVIRVDGKIIDGSLAHSLQRAKEQLLS